MINLLPTELIEARRFGRRNRQLLTYSILLFLIGVSSSAVLLLNSQLLVGDENRLREEISQKQAESAKLAETQKNIENIAADLKTIDQLYGGEVIFSQLLPQIGSLLPSGTILNGLTLTGGSDDPLNLEIDMERQELAAIFQQNLINSDLFDAADIASINSKGEGGTDDRYLFSATISARFTGSKKPTTSNATSPPQTNTPTNGGAQ